MKLTIALFMLSSLLIAGCTGGSAGSTSGRDPDVTDEPGPPDDNQVTLPRSDVRGLEQLFVYRPESPYASVLKDCAIIESAEQACTLTTLPFITQATPDFSRDDILDRLLVTHHWMGERFDALLADAPEHMLPLFGSLTSIVIGSTVRPSNYWGGTGGIQLDPQNLWLNLAEKATVSIEEDFRSDFGADLQFWGFGTLRKGGQPAIYFYSLVDTQERTLMDIRLPVYRLLYHELAHAVDFLPGASVPFLDAALLPYEALYAVRDLSLAPQLYADLPLHSQVLYDLAQVSFNGRSSTELQRSFTPADVGAEMALDGAVKYYGYSTVREDFATLFAMAMMKMDFDIDHHIAFVQKPVNESSYTCDELTVGWGARNRLADSLVRPRAQWVVESIYGQTPSIGAFFASEVGQSTAMTPGVDWCTNRDAQMLSADSLQPRQRTEEWASRGHGPADIDGHVQLEGERRLYDR